MTTYAIRGGEEGTRRLDLLSRVVGPTTESFLDAAGIAAGMSCLDAGSGAGHVSRSLARRVGPSGRVVGLERDPVKLAAARSETEREGLRNLEYREADVTTWSEPEAYDVVYGRFIVSHLRDRPAFVRRLWQSLRAPGTLILEDIDFSGAFCYPADPAYARYCELYVQVIDRRGGDANVGPRLYGLCLAAGFAELDVQVVQPTHCGTCQEKELSLSTMVNIADAVVAEKLAGAEEVRETIARLTALTTDPGSIVACPRIFQVRGRKVSP
jgi:2-polyprenyl-3-methyl-5-hydroxy-6-metoxy-1,4-benzoquinol methylase